MKILVINLDRSPERLQHMTSTLSAHGLTFERVAAVDARHLSEEEIRRWRQGTPSFYELGPGEVACFLSHRKCWEIAAANPDGYTVICEDDIYLGRDAAAVLSDVSWIPEGAGVIKLEAGGQAALIGREEVSRIGHRKLHRLYHDKSGAACYLLSSACARRLLEATSTFCDPVDQYIFNGRLPCSHGEPAFQLVPAVAIQEFLLHKSSVGLLGSSLRSERRGKRRTGLEKLRRELGRPFEQLGRRAYTLAMSLFGTRQWVKVVFH